MVFLSICSTFSSLLFFLFLFIMSCHQAKLDDLRMPQYASLYHVTKRSLMTCAYLSMLHYIMSPSEA